MFLLTPGETGKFLVPDRLQVWMERTHNPHLHPDAAYEKDRDALERRSQAETSDCERAAGA